MKIEDIRNQNLTLKDEEISKIKSEYRLSTAFGARKLDTNEKIPEVTFNIFNPHDFRNLGHFFTGIFRSCDSEELLKVTLKACLKEIEVLEKAFEQEDSLLIRDQISNVLSFLCEDLGYILLKESKDKKMDYECGFSLLPYSEVAERCNLVTDNKEAEKYLLKALMYNPHNCYLSYVLGCYYLFNCKKEEHLVLIKASDYFLSTRENYRGMKDNLGLIYKMKESSINHELINYCGCKLYEHKYYEKAFDMFMYAYELDKEENHRLKDRNSYCYNLALYYLNCSKKDYIDSLKNKYKRLGIKYLKELERIVEAKEMTFEEYIKDPLKDPDGIIKDYLNSINKS